MSTVRVPGTELKAVRLGSKHLALLSHLTMPVLAPGSSRIPPRLLMRTSVDIC